MNETKISIGVRLRAYVLSVRWVAILAILAVFLASSSSYANRGGSSGRKIPVIFDTDICDDIDERGRWLCSCNLPSSMLN